MKPFQNEPETDFSKQENVEAFRTALAEVKGKLGQSYPMIIDGAEVRADTEIESLNPADPEVVVGRFPRGDEAVAVRALDAAHRAFPDWARVPAEERAGFLFRASEEVRRRRHELSAWMVVARAPGFRPQGRPHGPDRRVPKEPVPRDDVEPP